MVYWCGSAGVGWYPNAGWSTPKQEQYTYIESPAPEDECNNIRNMLSNKNLHKVTSSWFNLCRLEHGSAPTCIRIPPYSSRTAPIHHYTPKQSSTPTYSRHLLRMNVITLETCWAIKKTFIKWHQVGSIYSTSKMMHGPINIRFVVYVATDHIFICILQFSIGHIVRL